MFAVAAHIAAAYWLTASTSFANPAVILGRAFTNTVTGVRLADVAPFMHSQCAGYARRFYFAGFTPRLADPAHLG